MKERCIRKTAQYNRLWQPGEVRTATRRDASGKVIASDHFRLLKPDEVVRPTDEFSEAERDEKRREMGARDKDSAIQLALGKLDPDDDRHWTANGLPSVQEVCKQTDLDISRAEIQAAAPGFDRETARNGVK